MSEDNKRLVMRVHEEVWNRGRVELIEELYVPHFRAHYPEPFSWSGLEGTREAHAMLKAAFPDWHETVDDIVAEGDRDSTPPAPTAASFSVWPPPVSGSVSTRWRSFASRAASWPSNGAPMTCSACCARWARSRRSSSLDRS